MTTSSTFDIGIACANSIFQKFENTGYIIDEHKDNDKGVTDVAFESELYRRAHISIVDARESKKLWLLHVTIFPHLHNPAPIYGFDIIAGPTRVSGAFHDFSFAGSHEIMMPWFANRTKELEWNKRRELPDWAKQIFSDNIVAIGAVGVNELSEFTNLGLETLDYYLNHIHVTQRSNKESAYHQDNYCYYQRQNPHTPKVLVNLGFTTEEAESFVNNRLFPLVNNAHK